MSFQPVEQLKVVTQGWKQLVPSRADYADLPGSLRLDLVAGVTVAIVALPLALGFGVTSGMGATAGLITAVVAGFVAAVFGGSHLQVSGPTGAMTVVLVPIVERYGVSAVYLVSVLAGVMVVVAALAGFGKAITYIPWPVVEGLTAGIGVVIILQQLPLILGVKKPAGENTVGVAIATVKLVAAQSTPSIVVASATVVLLLLIHRLRPNWPAAIIGVIIMTIASTFYDSPRIGELPSVIPQYQGIDLNGLGTLVNAAIAVAALAALESLLSARVADGMSDVEPSKPDRELFGQGLANVASGLFGGMPATGAFARTAVNVRAGARTRLSAIFHAVVLLVGCIIAAPLISKIPLAALAGVLVVTASRMIERHAIKAILHSTTSDAVVFLITITITVFVDLITAVEAGIAISAVLALRALASTSAVQLDAFTTRDAELAHKEKELLKERIAVYRMDGALFFGVAQQFLDALTQSSDVKVLILRLDRIQMIDATGAYTLGQLVEDLRGKGVAVLLKGVKQAHAEVLASVGVLAELDARGHVFEDIDDAITHARKHMAREEHHKD